MRGGRKLRLGVAAAALAAACVGLWEARRPITSVAVARYLRANGVDGHYAIDDLTPSRVVLARVRLGPASRPDLVADRVAVEIGGYPLWPHVEALHLVRPILRMSVDSDGLSFGSIDSLLPAPTGERRPLPDIDVTIDGGRLEATTPAGRIVAIMSGSGRLADGFAADARIVPTALAVGGCAAHLAGGRARVETAGERLTISGGGGVAAIGCDTARAERIAWLGELRTDSGLEAFEGRLSVAAARATAANLAAARPQAEVEFGGTMARLSGRWRVAAGKSRLEPAGFGAMSAHGSFAATPGEGTLDLRGDASMRDASYHVGDLTAPMRATPIAAMATIFSDRLRAAAADADVDISSFALRLAHGNYTLHVPRASVVGATGLRLALSGGEGIRSTVAGTSIDGTLTADGGGLPAMTALLSDMALDGDAGEARIEVATWKAGAAEIAMPSLDVAVSGRTATLKGQVRYSGRVAGAVTMRGGNLDFAATVHPGAARLVLAGDCLTASFDELRGPALAVAAARARICSDGRFVWDDGRFEGGLRVAALAVEGRSAGRALRLRTEAAKLRADGRSLTLAPLGFDARIGDRSLSGRVDARLRIDGTDANGTLRDLVLVNAALPVRIDQGHGGWSFAGGRLHLANGGARVTDALQSARFNPLRLSGIEARVGDGRVDATGRGALSSSGAELFGFTAGHDLASGVGRADLDTGALVFSDRLQPFEITEALRGVIENVAGTVHGTGQVRWTADALESDGRLRIDGVSLATAALGPVTGVSGEVAIDDLFALTTPPGQVVDVASMNPGVSVEHGRFRFEMLGPTAARIETAQWPFAGGTLTLRPTTLSVDEPRREFTLDVVGMDAQLFLQRFELENVNATGTFDGMLPLLFEGSSGRIVGGTLTARSGGGLLQYVGEVGADSMGAAGKLAFDALKRMRYRSLSVSLDGDLDGEIVTAVRFSGTNEAPVTPAAGLPVRAAGLPFKFNVTVRAPFRRLLGTAASFSDAREVIKSAAPADPDAAQPVQPR